MGLGGAFCGLLALSVGSCIVFGVLALILFFSSSRGMSEGERERQVVVVVVVVVVVAVVVVVVVLLLFPILLSTGKLHEDYVKNMQKMGP